MCKPVLMVFSHQRWAAALQRPQQLLSRLADRWSVVFVEEPTHAAGPARLARHGPLPGVEVLVPHTPLHASGFHDEQLHLLQTLLATYLRSTALRCDIAWLTTPMALPLLRTADPRCVVYDCWPDDLGAPQRLRQRESALLLRAGLVLTAGQALHEARRGLHPQVHHVAGPLDSTDSAAWAQAADQVHGLLVQALAAARPLPFVDVVDGPRVAAAERAWPLPGVRAALGDSAAPAGAR
jgi:UDP-galactopyranose mutase